MTDPAGTGGLAPVGVEGTGCDVTSDATEDETYGLLRRGRVWNCFAIADRAPPFRSWSQIAVARERDGEGTRHGVFVGIRSGDCLITAGGTHVAGIFTHPDARRRGCATAVTGALVRELFTRGCRDVVLNVVADNEPAIRVYERLGFRTHDRYRTGLATRRTR